MASFITTLTNLWPRKIRSQLILGIALVHLVLMALFVYDLVKRQQKFLKKQNYEQALSVVNDFAVNSTSYIIGNDFDGLERLVQSHRNLPNLKYAMFLSTDGVVLAHTDSKYLGARTADSVSLRLKSIPEAQTLIENNYILDIAVPVLNNKEIIGWARIGLGQEYISNNLISIARDGIIYILIALLIGTFFAIIIASRLSKGLYKLIYAADHIRSGDRNIRVEPFRSFEISKLGTAFNKMLDDVSANEKLLAMVQENMPVGLWMLDEKGNILSGNKAGREIWAGMEYVGIEGYGVYKGWFTDTGKLVEPHQWAAAIAVTEGKPVLNQEIDIECFDKTRKTILNSAIPLRDNDEKIVGAVVINVDISEKKKSVAEIAEKENLLRLFVEHSPASLAMFDTEMRYIIESRRWKTDYGLGDLDITGKTHYEIFPTVPQRWKDIHQRCIAGAVEKSDEDSFIKEDGSIEWIKWEIHPWEKASGEIGGIIMFTEVITEKKKMEQELAQSEERHRSLVENISDAIVVLDGNAETIYQSPSVERILGYRPKDVKNKKVFEFVHPNHLQFVMGIFQRSASSPGASIPESFQMLRKDGQYIWIEGVISNLLHKSSVQGFIVNFRDITERKKAEAELQKINHDIGERVKELRCLYLMSNLSNDPAKSMEDILQECVDVIPPSYQYPEITCARILFGGQKYESPNFTETIWKQEANIITADSNIGKVEVYYTQQMPDEQEGPFLKEERLLINSIADILGSSAERRKGEQEILRLNRLYQFISQINESMLKLESRNEIFSAACEIAIQYGKFRMAWIGFVDDKEERVIPHAIAGYDEGYLESIRIATDNYKVTGRGPTGKAVRSKTYQYCNDIANDPGMGPWREEALKRNYRSSISLPIIVNSQLAAVYTLYMSETFFFNESEIRLLQEVTDNIAYALDKIRLAELHNKAEIELRESEEKFRSLVEQSLVGVYILQNDKFLYVNPGFEKAIGYSKEELLGKITFESLVHEEDLEKVRKNYSLRLGGENPTSQYIFRAIRRDGSVMYLEVIASTIIYNGKPAIIGTLVDITGRIEEEKRIGKAVNDAQERERIQIGMELHDNVKQIMAASLMHLDFIKQSLNANHTDKAIEITDNIKGYIREAIDELRRLSHQLAPSINTEDTLAEKIEKLVNTMNTGNHLQIAVDVDEFKKPIHNDIQTAFYRILQEQFNNILKYAKASSVSISIKLNHKDIHMNIKDDGKGFDTTTKKTGIGLENIKRRAQVLGGQVKIISSPGNGCEVDVQIPIKQS